MVCSYGYIQLHIQKVLLFRYCIPMDNARPSLDLKYFKDICPDKNGISKCEIMNWVNCGTFQVPVIAVFTKYDQFKREISLKLEDQGCDPSTDLEDELDRTFRHHYLAEFEETPPFVRLESENFIIDYRVWY